jgi:hypothetical protein
MQGNRYAVNYDISNAPTDDSTHSYQCDLDTTTGTWQFSYDGTAWQSYQDDYWKTAVGATVQWTGEIYNKEDDMPGTATDKCNFTG